MVQSQSKASPEPVQSQMIHSAQIRELKLSNGATVLLLLVLIFNLIGVHGVIIDYHVV